MSRCGLYSDSDGTSRWRRSSDAVHFGHLRCLASSGTASMLGSGRVSVSGRIPWTPCRAKDISPRQNSRLIPLRKAHREPTDPAARLRQQQRAHGAIRQIVMRVGRVVDGVPPSPTCAALQAQQLA